MQQKLKRLPDWQARLGACLDEWRLAEFHWGEADCACFAAAAVEAMTGHDPMGDLRGGYDDLPAAQAALKAAGHHSLYHLLMKCFGRPVSPAFARPGDIALDHGADGPTLGVVNGRHTAFLGVLRPADGQAEHPIGLVFEPTKTMRHIFKIGG